LHEATRAEALRNLHDPSWWIGLSEVAAVARWAQAVVIEHLGRASVIDHLLHLGRGENSVVESSAVRGVVEAHVAEGGRIHEPHRHADDRIEQHEVLASGTQLLEELDVALDREQVRVRATQSFVVAAGVEAVR